ncbi:MAG: branched-chain amino acid transport system permease protein [Actinomycetota bacterium]|jgi:branched-chain amino acid transport system permease protein|nr:branched-chain amino acid transport system permease protein [Actinomycetota bacterium]
MKRALRPLGLAGAVAAVVGCLTPWATFFFGYPGKVTLSGFPGGARLYPLILAVAAGVLLLVDVHGRRRSGLMAALGGLAIAGYNAVAIAKDGGGLGAVAFGAWLTLAGTALLAAAHSFGKEESAIAHSRFPNVKAPAPVELLIIAGSLAALLYVVVLSLKIEESTRFVSFVAFLGFAASALQRVDAFEWLQSVFDRHRQVTLGAAAIAAIAFPFTQAGSSYWLRVFASIGVFAAAAIGLNIVVGLAGLLDLGYIAFFGVGAYTGALLGSAARTTYDTHWPFLLVVLIGATVAAVFGVVIGAPTLRLRGDYLAIVTLGFGEIFRISAFNLDWLTRGPNGIAGVPDLGLGQFNFGETHQVFGVTLPGFANYYFVELVLLAAVILMFTRLNDSRIGRAWVAIREDETAAAAMGINTVRMKLLAFAMGAFIAGAAGTVNAHVAASAAPDSFTFLESILLLAAVVLGGMGTVPGALLGSAALFVLPEKLRAFQDKRLLLFGLALILMMRFRPEGIVPSRRRQRELHDEDGADAMGTVAAP